MTDVYEEIVRIRAEGEEAVWRLTYVTEPCR